VRRKFALTLASALLAASAAGAKTPRAAPTLDPFSQRVLDAHNAERRAVGAAPLRWNPVLQAHAQAYAERLAKLGRLVHAPRDGRGIERENLVQGLPDWGPERLVQEWIGEKRHFHAGAFPDICSGDEWGCTHFTQMIWPATTDLGCGLAQGGGYQWLVCRYSPGGNRTGFAVGRRGR
jgi:hypothetical protein